MDRAAPPTFFDVRKEYYRQDWHDYYEAIFPLVPRRSFVLDIGCGGGHLMSELTSRLDCEVVGVDVSEEAVAACRARGLSATRINVETDAIPGRYDVVLLCAVLEHLIDPVRLLDRLRSNLGKGGLLVVGVPNFSHLAARLLYLLGKNAKAFGDGKRDRDLGLQPYDHIQFFTEASLKHLLRGTGYEPLEASYCASHYKLQRESLSIRGMMGWLLRLPYGRIRHPAFSHFIAIKASRL